MGCCSQCDERFILPSPDPEQLLEWAKSTTWQRLTRFVDRGGASGHSPDVVDRFAKITRPLVRPRRTGQFNPQYIKPVYFGGLPPLRATSTKENAWAVEIPDWLVEAIEKHLEVSDVTPG